MNMHDDQPSLRDYSSKIWRDPSSKLLGYVQAPLRDRPALRWMDLTTTSFPSPHLPQHPNEQHHHGHRRKHQQHDARHAPRLLIVDRRNRRPRRFSLVLLHPTILPEHGVQRLAVWNVDKERRRQEDIENRWEASIFKSPCLPVSLSPSLFSASGLKHPLDTIRELLYTSRHENHTTHAQQPREGQAARSGLRPALDRSPPRRLPRPRID